MDRSRLVFLVAFALALLWAAPPDAAAQYFGRNKVQYEDFDFHVIETPHFEYYYYSSEAKAAKDATLMAERWYYRHSQTFLRQFTEKKPIIFYANDADFQQTNIVSGLIPQGVGGVTESLKERVTMPLTGSYAATNHVLGHELVHSFQYDIALNESNLNFELGRLPLWLVEGMAEYLSVGRQDAHTTMWLRDYLLRDDLPTIEQMTEEPQAYFPYRFGQAYSAYIGGKYGDPAVTNLFKLAGRVGVDSAFVYALGITADSLSQEWKEAVRSTYLPLMQDRNRVSEIANLVLGDPSEDNQLFVGPVVSPDGQYVAFFGRKNLFTLTLQIADTETGEIVKTLPGSAFTPEFDAIRFIESAGSWSPDGTRFAFVIFEEGDNELAILDVSAEEVVRRIEIQGIGALSNPAWSPDGSRIAFTGQAGGISNLYVLDLQTETVRQLTNDRYADLQPAWSPNGEVLAFTTDRGAGPLGTNFETLDFGTTGLALIDVETGEIRVLRPFGDAQHHNPQFSPDGRSLFFISTQDGFKDIYRWSFPEEEAYRVTYLKRGVSGITGLSPAMTVADQSGEMVFSVFANGGYTIYALGPDALQGEPVEPVQGVPVASLLVPYRAYGEGLVSNYLHHPLEGLPENVTLEPEPYDPSLSLTYVAPPTVGVGVRTGGVLGTQAGVRGGVSFFFSDLLGNHLLGITVRANGSFKDIGGRVSYLDRENRINYGASVAHIPIRRGGFVRGRPVDVDGDGALDFPTILRIEQRTYIDLASVMGRYPLSTTRRFEASGGLLSIGFGREIDRFAYIPGRGIVGRVPLEGSIPERERLYFFQSELAFVTDFSFFGFTSPVSGGRSRFAISPRVGTFTYVQGLADYRRYFFFQPLTFAVRGLHIGNYAVSGRDLNDARINLDAADFTREFIGAPYRQGFVRGYSFSSFDRQTCANLSGFGCTALLRRLYGTRILAASAELRVPFLGVDQFGLISFPYLPTQLFLFGDAGVAWTAESPPVFEFVTDADALLDRERVGERCIDGPQGRQLCRPVFEVPRYPVFSVGAGARVNVLGAIIVEFYFAHPFQRPGVNWDFGFRLVPGW